MKKNRNKTGFKIPDNYFADFEAQLYSKIDEINFPPRTGFKVPENYFERLDDSVFNKITASEKQHKVISLFPTKYLGYAAAFAACLVIGFSIFNTANEQETLDALQLATIDKYIDEGNLNFDLYDITTFIDDDNIINTNLEEQQFSEAVLKNYLLENVDEKTLIDEQ
ncbi:hypothetical protein QRD02_05220 [Aequorivita sp. SDUM287046]|uniref:Anti sigma-E protein RseA N-terminal domain-containing protein n=1 Tax=Aequorivita aurantiaca TaxID=3053356 RepID=A0ABT8DKK8_9FLAO|nr:hypothetical protein [Aequorivita aurantiaca]MDN3723773.1 hypothetical protein [Aequorivita aurantiaca]